MKYALMSFCTLWLLCLPTHIYGIGFSLVLSNPHYSQFDLVSSSYSTLFQQGRDGFHWLDLSYSDYDYVTPTERGATKSVGTSYRFSQRLRWARHFKPFLFAGGSINQLTKTNRIRVGEDHSFIGHLDRRKDTHYVAFLGAGYLWQKGDLVIGFSLDYAYDNGYLDSFWAPVFLISLLR